MIQFIFSVCASVTFTIVFYTLTLLGTPANLVGVFVVWLLSFVAFSIASVCHEDYFNNNQNQK